MFYIHPETTRVAIWQAIVWLNVMFTLLAKAVINSFVFYTKHSIEMRSKNTTTRRENAFAVSFTNTKTCRGDTATALFLTPSIDIERASGRKFLARPQSKSQMNVFINIILVRGFWGKRLLVESRPRPHLKREATDSRPKLFSWLRLHPKKRNLETAFRVFIFVIFARYFQRALFFRR